MRNSPCAGLTGRRNEINPIYERMIAVAQFPVITFRSVASRASGRPDRMSSANSSFGIITVRQ